MSKLLPSATGIGSPVEVSVKDGVVWLTSWSSGSRNRAWANPPLADLAAALGLVTREELAARDEAIDIWRVKLRDAGNALAKARKAEAERDALRAELDEAEATIARVRHLRDVSGDTVGVEELDAALDPKPASKRVILTADMAGVKVNGYDFTKGVLVALPAEDADRLISAGLAKGTTDE